MTTSTVGDKPPHLFGLEEMARTTLRRIERRRFELVGLTTFLIVAFAVSIFLVAFGSRLEDVQEFEGTARALRFSLVPLSVGFAAYLIEKERQLRRTTRDVYALEAQAAERLKLLYEMKDSLLTAVSHEVRTPLTKALGAAELIEQRGDRLPDDRRREFAASIVANLRTLERLLGDLMDVDRLWRDAVDINRHDVDLGEIVTKVVAEFEWGDGRQVHVEAPSVVVPVDRAKVERILETLLANARRHTPPGTETWLRVSPYDGGAVLVVEDSGPGVPPDLREVIFRPFEHGVAQSAHSPGTGIGLTVVRRLAELHGGRAWVDERPGGGASFRVSLPREAWTAKKGSPVTRPGSGS